MDSKRYISQKIYSKKSIKKVKDKIRLLGVSAKFDVYTFLNVRLFGAIVIFLVVLCASKFGYLLAPLMSFMYYRLITFLLLDYSIKKRTTVLEREAITFFEILTLSLETGRNLREAINVTIDSIDGEIADEFREAMREVRFGKSMTEALEDMEACIPSDSIKNIVMSLREADIYGSSIIESLNNQIDYLREKRKLEVKAIISKIPIKISVISVFFFIPLILVIILAPVLLGYLN